MQQPDTAVDQAWSAFAAAAEDMRINVFDAEPEYAFRFRGRGAAPHIKMTRPPRPCSAPYSQLRADA
eukprot:2820414-Pyramimonas_sp.AAC.1